MASIDGSRQLANVRHPFSGWLAIPVDAARAHLAACGAPIVGDVRYGGGPMPELIEFFLHAESVRLPDLTVTAPLPDDRRAVLAALGLADAVPSGA